MTIKIEVLLISAIAGLSLFACQNNQPAGNTENKAAAANMTDIPYVTAQNYFVNNTVTSLDNPKIETAEKFAEIFGMAATMGDAGKPTAIDFSRQYVIAVIKPVTDLETSVRPTHLQKDEKGNIVLTYRTVTGPKQSFTTCPNFAIIVDKAENGNITLKEVQ